MRLRLMQLLTRVLTRVQLLTRVHTVLFARARSDRVAQNTTASRITRIIILCLLRHYLLGILLLTTTYY